MVDLEESRTNRNVMECVGRSRNSVGGLSQILHDSISPLGPNPEALGNLRLGNGNL